MDWPILIDAEIVRLQNSLQHLRETQELLGQHITENPNDQDVEIEKALEENETVIGSQEERIGILRMALAEKGMITGSHYNVAPSNSIPAEHDIQRRGDLVAGDQTNGIVAESANEAGIHL
ncbi:uncharacterized protein BT62DRAFT_662808 [Guyanagaster necrorhizus]|uniref:Uncharacterized protein n=1 Tax=Guyanagaster necrorhizus TaxID=856835 RepID=A0A9P7VX22_9AGAR|nr:uncharacterized protein BT62DRAFT_662808 [Guyanagaster necrorhizus MCA 3950]KAG7449101.1 hypothetical protein BT62DRAFT_662808 [Guyanagaster necrorhizus MCA 3950]